MKIYEVIKESFGDIVYSSLPYLHFDDAKKCLADYLEKEIISNNEMIKLDTKNYQKWKQISEFEWCGGYSSFYEPAEILKIVELEIQEKYIKE